MVQQNVLSGCDLRTSLCHHPKSSQTVLDSSSTSSGRSIGCLLAVPCDSPCSYGQGHLQCITHNSSMLASPLGLVRAWEGIRHACGYKATVWRGWKNRAERERHRERERERETDRQREREGERERERERERESERERERVTIAEDGCGWRLHCCLFPFRLLMVAVHFPQDFGPPIQMLNIWVPFLFHVSLPRVTGLQICGAFPFRLVTAQALCERLSE